MAGNEVYRIDIPIETQDHYSEGFQRARSSATRFEQEMNRTTRRVNRRMDKITRGRWSMSIRAVDRASRVIRRVGAFASRVTSRTYRLTIRALDLATRPIRGIMRSVSSTLGTLGLVGGVAGGVVIPLKLVADRQDTESSFEVMLGSAEKAKKRVDELTEFAQSGVFMRDDVFEASRILEVFSDGAISTGKDLKMVGDVASGTKQPIEDVALWMGRMYDSMEAGRPIGESTARLQEMGAISGNARDRMEELAESGKDISKIWPEVTKEFSRFDGMMEKLSGNLKNQFLYVWSFFQEDLMRPWGEGLADSIQPHLESFTEWQAENRDAIEGWKDSIKDFSQNIGEKAMNGISKSANYIRENYLENDEFKDLSFSGKIKFVLDDMSDLFSDWWEGGGEDKTAELGEKIGKTVKDFFLGIIGADSDNDYATAGYDIGTTFAKSFIEGFDAIEVGKAVIKKLKDINVEGVKDAASGDGIGGLLGAGFIDLLVLGSLTKLLRGPGKLGKGLLKGGKNAGGWLLGKAGKGKGGKTPKTPPPTKSKPEPKKTPNSKGGKVIYDHNGRPITSGQSSPPKSPKNDKWWKGLKPPKGTGKLLKKIPYVGPLIGGLSIAGASKEEKPKVAGSVAGGAIGGAAGGAAVGSIIPGPGTLVGSVAGGMLGAAGGEKAVGWGKEKLDNMTETYGPTVGKIAGNTLSNLVHGNPREANSTGSGDGSGTAGIENSKGKVSQSLEALANWTAQASNWVVGAFRPLQGSGETINHSATSLNTWLAQSSGWVVGAFSPLQGVGDTINHSATALNTWLAQASGWVVGAFSPIQGAGESINHSTAALNTWLAQSSGWVVGAFSPLQGTGERINHSVSALNTWLAQSSGWVVGAFSPLQGSGERVNQSLSALSTWTAQASGWVVGGIRPIQSSGGRVSGNLSILATWSARASGWVASISGIQSSANSVKSALSGLAVRVRNTSVPKISMPSVPSVATNAAPKMYASGTNFHPGGTAVVGDGGGSELIKYPGGGMTLSPAQDTLMNLPRGTQVYSHGDTKKLVDVPSYANGTGGNDVPPSSSGNTLSVQVGDIVIQTSASESDMANPETLAESIADDVASALADRMEDVVANMN